MTSEADGTHPRPRRADAGDAEIVATLLDEFNTEFATPTPGATVLSERLTRLLPEGRVAALLIGEPAVGIALISFRPNVWYSGEVALLDELYVRPDMRNRRLGAALLDAACGLARDRGSEVLEINVDENDVDARRFYEAHGFANHEPGTSEQMLYYYRDL